MGMRGQHQVAVRDRGQGDAMASRYRYPPFRIEVERRRPKHRFPFLVFEESA